MSRLLRYLTHPQVDIDPDVPVPEWGLSDLGRKRAQLFAGASYLKSTSHILCSAETKAMETAEIIAVTLDIPYTVDEMCDENDRSATGYLKADEFEEMADAFFAEPEKSVRGWERAVDAQKRIVAAANTFMQDHLRDDILMVGHGGVGTLLYCWFAGLNIDRKHDQHAGGGNVFAYNVSERAIVHGWRPLEECL